MIRKLIASKGVKILNEVAKRIAKSLPTNRNILLVEDDPDLQWRLARLLTTDGNRVVGTSSAAGALALLNEWKPDLVLAADKLPDDDGLPLARTLSERFPQIPVIVMAEGRSDVQVKEPTGSTATLIKPFHFEALRSLINAIQLAATPAE